MNRSRVVRVPFVFDEDDDLLLRMARQRAPYPAPTSGFGDPPQRSRLPWFKAVWGVDPSDEDEQSLLNNERLLKAAAELYAATVVQPQKVLVNVMGPMAVLPPHLDPPTFRGTERWVAETDDDKLSKFAGRRTIAGLMGTSGLFEQWRVQSASAVAWHYPGTDGDYIYWHEGPLAAPGVESTCKNPDALVGDNDSMYHQIGAIGDPTKFLPTGTIATDAWIEATDGGRWAIADPRGRKVTYEPEDIRISMVWKANCFADAEAQRVYHKHLDDLTLEQATDIFVDDLHRRSTQVERPSSPLSDQKWIRQLMLTYGFPTSKLTRR